MMSKKGIRLLDHPDYPEIVRRYAYDLVRFSVEVFGYKPTPQQVSLYRATQLLGSRTSVSSGHGTGKTFSFALIAFWHLIFYQKSNTFITAPKLDTVKDGVWKEFADHHETMINNGFGWLADYIVVEAKKVFIRDHKMNWFIIPKSAPRGSPTNLAGTHRISLLWIADEASGIPTANFGVIGGALTEGERNRFLMASQPTQPSGFFYDTHHRMSIKNGGVWLSLVFNSEHSPRVSHSFLKEKMLEYGGRDSMEYSIKVLGEFPDKAEGLLLGRSEVESAFADSCVLDSDEWGWLLSSDIGGGNYRDDSTLVRAKVVGNGDYEYSEDGEAREARRVHVVSVPLCTNSKNPVQFSGAIYQYITEENIVSDHILIDKGGGGDTVCYNLEQKGVPMVTPVIWGKPCFRNKSKDRFRNQRAQCNASAARAVKEGRLTFDKSIPQDIVTKIMDQASRIPFFFDEYQRIQIKSKKDMMADGLSSPDIWDSIAQLFLEDAFYTPTNKSTQYDDEKQKVLDAMIAEAEVAFADA